MSGGESSGGRKRSVSCMCLSKKCSFCVFEKMHYITSFFLFPTVLVLMRFNSDSIVYISACNMIELV